MPLIVAGLAIPTTLALDLLRRPADRDEHLRAQRRDDARPRAGHRLLAVPGQPLPRGAARGRDVGKAVERRGRHRRQGGRRSPAWPWPSACSGCCSSTRPRSRRSGIAGSLVVRRSVVFALTFLPAVLGMLGPRVNSLSLGRARQRDPRRLAGHRGSGRRRTPTQPLGAPGALGDAQPMLVLVPDALLPAAAGLAVPADQPGRAGCGGAAAGRRAATPSLRSETSSRRRRDEPVRDPRRRPRATRRPPRTSRRSSPTPSGSRPWPRHRPASRARSPPRRPADRCSRCPRRERRTALRRPESSLPPQLQPLRACLRDATSRRHGAHRSRDSAASPAAAGRAAT